jgi:hypothetical protein
MATRLAAEEDYETALKKFSALAFLDLAEVCQRFTTHSQNFLEEFGNTQEHRKFVDYFQKTWIGTPQKRARFPKQMWNCRDITLLDLPRTVNSVESWHSQLQRTFLSPHPTFFAMV